MKVLLFMTGGTICSFSNEFGHLASNTDEAVPVLVDHLRDEGYEDVEFEVVRALDTLSENMTFSKLNLILDAFRELEGRIDSFDGVIIAHGTDTLAYTSSLLALALAGYSKKPIFLVSSNRTLSDPSANGHANFRAAVDLIANNFGAGVYVPYRNSDGVMYIHHGAHLKQCANFTDDFYSYDMMPIGEARPYSIAVEYPLLSSLGSLCDCVVRVEPYVGLDYSIYNFPKRIRAVLHGSYHSATACIERRHSGQAFSSRSLIYLLDRCKCDGIDVFLTPLKASQKSDMAGSYYTMVDLISHGIKPIFSMTSECAYMKLALAYSLGYEREEVELFLEREIASEKLDY